MGASFEVVKPAPDIFGSGTMDKNDRPLAAFKYNAFISYAHEDKRFAMWLHRFLESYRFPRGISVGYGVPKTLKPVFLDAADFEASTSLETMTHKSLEQSRSLVVVCSSDAAISRYVSAEIKTFRRLPQGKNIFTIISPGAKGLSDPESCFPEELRGDVPLAADATKENGKKSAIRLIAGISGLAFDELWDRERRRHSTWIRKVALSCALILGTIGFLYYEAVEHGAGFWSADQSRSIIDVLGISLAHPVASDDLLMATASECRKQIEPILLREGGGSHWVWHNVLNGVAQTYVDLTDVWTHSQAITGLLGAPEVLHNRELESRLHTALLIPFQRRHELIIRGDSYGWLGFDPPANAWAEPALWTALALIRDEQNAQTERQRDISKAALYRAERILERHYRNTSWPGEWNGIPDAVARQHGNRYSTALALQVLLDLRRARLTWLGRNPEFLIAQTARSLEKSYGAWDPSVPSLHGWKISDSHDESPWEEGLSLQIMYALLRANLEAGIPLRPDIAHNASLYVATLIDRQDYHRSLTPTTGRYVQYSRGPYAKRFGTQAQREVYFNWYPWALAFCVEWRLYQASKPIDRADRRHTREALSHLVVAIGPQAVAASQTGQAPWEAAENLVGFDAISNIHDPRIYIDRSRFSKTIAEIRDILKF